MSFQTKHGLYGLSSSYDLSFFQPHPETDGKFSSGASVILAYARLRRGKKKKSPVKHRIRIELDMVPEHGLPLKFDRHKHSKKEQ